jgi:hypothetical protein
VVAFALLCGSAAVWADEERPYTEGVAIDAAYVRTKYGMFDEYMKYLDGPYKKLMDEQKKAGLIVESSVYRASPKNPHEPDIILITVYRNWAAFDGLRDKVEPIEKIVYGSIDSANKGAVDREKVREILGSQLMQKRNLK